MVFSSKEFFFLKVTGMLFATTYRIGHKTADSELILSMVLLFPLGWLLLHIHAFHCMEIGYRTYTTCTRLLVHFTRYH